MRKVFCRKYQKDMEGLDKAPFPGPKGQEIYDNISKQAWQEWLEHQTMLINENGLKLMEPSTRTFLDEQREKFFSGADYERPKGYVPPAN